MKGGKYEGKVGGIELREGFDVGSIVGLTDGVAEEVGLGLFDGLLNGDSDGFADGCFVGDTDGDAVGGEGGGFIEGLPEGSYVEGVAVGSTLAGLTDERYVGSVYTRSSVDYYVITRKYKLITVYAYLQSL